MGRVADICRVLMWIFFAYVILMQSFVTLGIIAGGDVSAAPIVASTLLMTIAVILFATLPHRGKTIALILAVVAAALFIAVAVWLSKEFPPHLNAQGGDSGMTGWRIVYRHLSPILIPVLMLPVWLESRADYLEARERAKREAPDHYIPINNPDEE